VSGFQSPVSGELIEIVYLSYGYFIFHGFLMIVENRRCQHIRSSMGKIHRNLRIFSKKPINVAAVPTDVTLKTPV
jgi:hypothetical protein